MKCCVIIPAYNEADRLAPVLQELTAAGFDVIVVNDGSPDQTDAVIARFSVKHISHCTNLGQGAALRSGTELAHRLGYDVVAHYDADGQHRLTDLKQLLATLETEELDVVIGSRFLGIDSAMPIAKKLIYFFAKLVSRYALQLDFTDPQNGLRAFKLRVWPAIRWNKDNFEHCTEILTRIKQGKFPYREIPIQINYHEQSANKAVRPKVSMGLRILWSRIFD